MSETKPQSAIPAGGKKPWEPPRIKTGQLFETNSLACGKISSSEDQCLQEPTTS